MGRDPDASGRRSRPSLSAEIIADMRRQIATGALSRGGRLPSERQLAEQFGVSQPTMREVVRALEAMGLLQVHHGRGVFVSGDLGDHLDATLHTYLEFEDVGLVEVLEVRGALGTLGARQAARRAGEADKDLLRQAAAACDTNAGLSTVEELAESVVRFQAAVSAAAHNPLLYAIDKLLIRVLLGLQVEAKRAYGVDYWRGQIDQFRDDRWRIVTHIEKGQVAATVKAVTAYLEDQRELFENDPDMAAVRLYDH